jgi:DNA-binding transcriptional MerR regulator/tetratricopeptide (TPR) repeat protein
MRMAELCTRSGVARETIHFYLREGLLPRPRKGGRTVAYYDEQHLERLRTIRRLREEKYLPLAVIRRLLDSPAAAAERDVDALAEVLTIDPTLAEVSARAPAASPAATRQALARGLLGPEREGEDRVHGARREGRADPAEAKILTIVEETLGLDPRATELTLADLEACAADLRGLVSREAEIFFEQVIASADVAGTIGALRSGRASVARFITAYRDLMLRRIVEDLLGAIQHSHELIARASALPLSAERERELGAPDRRWAEVHRAARAGQDPGRDAASALVWHLFVCGAAADLAALPPGIVEAAGPRAAALVAWGGYERDRGLASLRALERAADAAPDLALGQILLGEASLGRGVQRRSDGGPSRAPRAGLLDGAVAALHRLVGADPASDPEPAAQALGFFHKGRVELALPIVLGRRRRGVESLERAVAIVEDPSNAPAIEPAARARVAANARLVLGRHHADAGDPAEARALLEAVIAADPAGPVAEAARAAIQALAARAASAPKRQS